MLRLSRTVASTGTPGLSPPGHALDLTQSTQPGRTDGQGHSHAHREAFVPRCLSPFTALPSASLPPPGAAASALGSLHLKGRGSWGLLGAAAASTPGHWPPHQVPAPAGRMPSPIPRAGISSPRQTIPRDRGTGTLPEHTWKEVLAHGGISATRSHLSQPRGGRRWHKTHCQDPPLCKSG